MQFEFSDKAAVVTGAGSGIGRASAIEFARHGARVAIADIDLHGAEETAQTISELGGTCLVIQTDVSDAESVRGMIDVIVSEFGGLDYAHNNAGTEGQVDSSRGTLETSEEEWDRLLAINLKGVWLCMRAEIPHMLERGGGAIVNSGSISSLVGSTAGFVAYSASKSGILGLTRSAALEFASRGIRVNTVCPGYIETPMTQTLRQGRHAEPGAIGDRIREQHKLGR